MKKLLNLQNKEKRYLDKKDVDAVYNWLQRQPEFDNTRMSMNFLSEFVDMRSPWRMDVDRIRQLQKDTNKAKIKVWAIWISIPFLILGFICQVISFLITVSFIKL